MAIINNGQAVVTGPVTVLWDGITRPEATEANDKHPAGWKYTIKFAIPVTDQAHDELKAMIDASVKTAYPTGAPRTFQHALYIEDGSKYPEVVGQAICTATTYDAPGVFSADGQPLDPRTCGLYGGAKVRLIVAPRVYNAKGNVGSGAWLNGTQIVDLTAPRISSAEGGGMTASQAASAFGFTNGAAAFTQPPAVAQTSAAVAPVPSLPPAPLAPNPGIVPPVPTDKLKALGHTVEALQAAGWTIEQMREHGFVI